MMKDMLIDNMQTRFAAYNDIVAGCDDDTLQSKLDVPKHKSLAEHLWCVVGARESYAAALIAGEWQGFACSMEQYSHAEFSAKLAASAMAFTSAVANIEEWTPEREALLLTLNEHEVMHEGQLIRHMYALGFEIPDSVKWS